MGKGFHKLSGGFWVEWFELSGGTPLHGSITLQGSKNAALPLLAGAVLHRGKTTLHNVPDIRDIAVMIQILRQMGCQVHKQGRTLQIDASRADTPCVDSFLGEQMRSSIILMGSLLGRFKKAVLPFPGGCVIGVRPIDLHVTSMQKLGAVLSEEDGMLCARTKGLQGARIHLHFPSVGATENIILAAVCAEGVTELENCAREPEIAELCRFLRGKGAKIFGIGTSCLRIEGVEALRDSTYTLMPDRIVAGTYLFAAAATRGQICLEGARPQDMREVLHILKKMGAEFRYIDERLWIDGRNAVYPVEKVCTDTYPGFPTDLQSQLLAALCVAEGKSIVRECIFEERFRIAPQLNRMGAHVTTDGREAVVEGCKQLVGAEVRAQELRGGAALIIAGLVARGTTRVYGRTFIERGYEDIAGDLGKLGATVSKGKTER